MNSSNQKPVVSIKKIIVITIAVIIITLAAIVFFVFEKSSDDVLTRIPVDAKSVLVIDLKSISQKLFVDDFGKTKKSRNELLKNIPDLLKDIDFSKNGLALLGKMALFTLEDTTNNSVSVYFTIKIDNDKVFNDFIKGICVKLNSKIEINHNFNTAFCDTFNLLIAWDKHYVIGTKTNQSSINTVNLLSKILFSNQEKSLMNTPKFSSTLTQGCDLLFFSVPYKKTTVKYLEPVNSDLDYLASYIYFNEGLIDVSTHLAVKKESLLDKLFPKNGNDFFRVIDTASCMVNMNLNIDPIAFSQLQTIGSKVLINDKSIPYLKSWNGQLNMVFSGTKIIENEFTTYDYDDDFNKIEIKKVKCDKIADIKSVFGYKQSSFDSILKLNRPIRENNDTLLFAGSNYLLRNLGGKLLVYPKQNTKPVIDTYKSAENVFLNLNCLKLKIWLKESGFMSEPHWYSNLSVSTIEVSVSKSKTIDIKSKIGFQKKNKNSIFSLLDDLLK